MRRCPGSISSSLPIVEEFDDYIAKPKANGYQSLHTIVRDQADRAIEIQIRTQAMHDHAEHGVAAHWAYKEAGSKGYAGVSASGEYDAKIAVLRQLLAWERDLAGSGQGLFEDRIYVLTPDAAIVELPQGATPVDFAYTRPHQPGPPLPRRSSRRRDGAAEHATAKRPDRRDHGGQGGRAVAGLAQRRPGLPGQPSRQGQGAGLVQRTDPARDDRPRPRSGGEAAAARRQDGGQAGGPGVATGLQVGRGPVRGGGQGRILAAQHRDAAAARPRRRWRRTTSCC